MHGFNARKNNQKTGHAGFGAKMAPVKKR